ADITPDGEQVAWRAVEHSRRIVLPDGASEVLALGEGGIALAVRRCLGDRADDEEEREGDRVDARVCECPSSDGPSCGHGLPRSRSGAGRSPRARAPGSRATQ